MIFIEEEKQFIIKFEEEDTWREKRIAESGISFLKAILRRELEELK